MLSSPDLSFSPTLPLDVFNQLRELLQQMAQAVGSEALVITEALLARVRTPGEWERQRFTLLVSEQFSALLVGEPDEMRGWENFTLSSPELELNVKLTFDSQAIAIHQAEFRKSSFKYYTIFLNQYSIKNIRIIARKSND
ncbi:hypothetical protein [Fortiea contorta]|uniref:hypothetical protein n=1 Tax=Fortiea contorta TaxID=1892405 RepID=UPI00034586C4